MELTGRATSELLKINRKKINNYFTEFRELVLQETIHDQQKELGVFENDESYFGAKRVRGKRGRGAAGKTPVFGVLKREGKAFVSIVPRCSREELLPIIQGKILEGSTIHTDGWKAYDGLILNGYTHYRVFHHENEFVRGKSHVNGIESFWSFAKRRLTKFNGLTDEKFILHLKECECRFNLRNENFEQFLIKIFFQK